MESANVELIVAAGGLEVLAKVSHNYIGHNYTAGGLEVLAKVTVPNPIGNIALD